jgi:hypothetical protein
MSGDSLDIRQAQAAWLGAEPLPANVRFQGLDNLYVFCPPKILSRRTFRGSEAGRKSEKLDFIFKAHFDSPSFQNFGHVNTHSTVLATPPECYVLGTKSAGSWDIDFEVLGTRAVEVLGTKIFASILPKKATYLHIVFFGDLQSILSFDYQTAP